MGRFVNAGKSAFQVALNSEIYVDKTGLLEYTNKVIDTKQGYICNSRPRRFGKSITADMLTAYYSRDCDSKEMFSNLEISRNKEFEKHLNKYDVIHIDIQWCIGAAGGADKVIPYIEKNVTGELRQYYPKELPENINSLPEALSGINASTEQKFIIIIDEWDVLIRDEAHNDKIQTEYIDFLRNLFKGTEPTKYIHLAYLTGILPIKKIKTQSALNNFDEFTMIDSSAFAAYIGFTDSEVKKLCKKYEKDYEQVKHWYDGYILGDYQVYNPIAVVNLMTKGGKFKSYWSQTGSYEAIVPLINMDFDGLKAAIIEMLSGANVKVNINSFKNDTLNFANKDDVLTYLIHLGYLGYDEAMQTAFVPNEEIRQELIVAVESTKWNELGRFLKESERLLEATLDMDEQTVSREIEKIHDDYTSIIRYNDENSLSSVLAIGYLSAMQYYFKPIRELPTGREFADFIFIPKPQYLSYYPALVVELKWNKKVQTAMQQIKEKKYPEAISRYTGDMLLVGINYDKKTKQHECIIEEYDTVQ
ncbi:ATP-binding protein [Eubacterium sp. MSJ-13]|uniref:AAA family ATPase n=1 Tax=Eubacterium sp. MSJ-13 TaxID=2841513 RepID=UPI001C1056F2|nr:AAA family ATPase [Eubacterium sp. MSJ-13]MBU5478999.1 ATP-binding protein [Eubacterium sp. MSJ-13]